MSSTREGATSSVAVPGKLVRGVCRAGEDKTPLGWVRRLASVLMRSRMGGSCSVESVNNPRYHGPFR